MLAKLSLAGPVHDPPFGHTSGYVGYAVHAEAWSWLETQIRPYLADAGRVLDFGGYDVNGSPRALFSRATDYVVLDARDGPNVDIVADAVTWTPSRELRGSFDVTLCTEVFEQVEHWRGILYNLWLTSKAAGTCLITCATDPRPPHSISGMVPPPPGEWYRNVAPDELLLPVRFLFRRADHVVQPRGDLYIRAVK